jgi:anaphase-promoting complex subunit 4
MLPSGNFLAVGWDDGVVRLMGLESNKVAHHIRVSEEPQTKISHIGCSTALTNSRGFGNQLPSIFQDAHATDLGLNGELEVADLPRELMFLEVDSALPKISPLPASSAGAG